MSKAEGLKLSGNALKLFETSCDPVLLQDGDRFLSCNKKCAEMLGFKTEKDIISLRPSDISPLYQPDGQLSKEKQTTIIEHAIKNSPHKFYWTHIDKMGNKLPMQVTLTNITQDGTQLLIATWKDQRTSDEIIESLKSKYSHQKEAIQQRSEFTAKLNHELRAPLTSQIINTELLLLEDLSSRQLELVQRIKTTDEYLLTLINNVLDVSKLEADKMQIVSDDFCFHELILDIKMLFSSQAEQKRLNFTITVDNSIPTLLLGDGMKITQCLINLISNAIKFTDEGYVNLNVSPISTDEDQVTLKFIISDSGNGIADEFNSIFDMYAQGEITKLGSGIGTALTKQLVTLMGGEIGVSQNHPHGSCFWFTVTLTALV
jgi:signal transduction histidine kinase